ncbi:MAG: hypothetical protein AB3P25_01020 [Candidatus Liberibacter psyllaurous]
MASCGSTTDVAPLPPPPTNHRISALEAAAKAIESAKEAAQKVIDDAIAISKLVGR